MSLANDDGVVFNSQEGLCNLAKDYFSILFAAQFSQETLQVVEHVQARLTVDDNALLLADFGDEEFKRATLDMHPDKAPGLDGLNAAFYQRFWNLYGGDVILTCKKWLNDGCFPDNINDTDIALIPKCDQPATMKDLQPISLCNVIYKILSKTLVNRLAKVIGKCASEEQSAFVIGRSIMDNALIAIEIIHFLKCKKKGLKGDASLKLDISKAYDRVSWTYLRDVLLKMGVDDQWVRWKLMCVSSVHIQLFLIMIRWVRLLLVVVFVRVTPFTLPLYYLHGGFVFFD